MSAEHERGGSGGFEKRRVVYCLIPPELAPKIHDLLRRHFADDPNLEVIVERRGRERRKRADRRARPAKRPVRAERRQIRSPTGRRMGERRAALVPVDEAPPLPRRARRYAPQLTFVARLEPSTQQAEDVDTARVVARYQSGDREAFATLYTRYFDRVYGYLKIVLKDSHEAEDATQQVFMHVFEALASYERRSQPFRAWLFIAVRNYAIQHLRKHHRIQVTDPEEVERKRERDSEADVELRTLTWLGDRDLLLLVERLPVPQRQVLVLRYMLGLTTKQAARVLGRRPNDISVLHYRALGFLRERLSALGRAPTRRGRSPARLWPRPARILRRRRFSLH